MYLHGKVLSKLMKTVRTEYVVKQYQQQCVFAFKLTKVWGKCLRLPPMEQVWRTGDSKGRIISFSRKKNKENTALSSYTFMVFELFKRCIFYN